MLFDDLKPAPPPPPSLHGIRVRPPAEVEANEREERLLHPPLMKGWPTHDDLKSYSLCRALLMGSEGRDAPYEREVSEAIARTLGRQLGAGGHLLVPLNLPLSVRAGLDSKTTSTGLELKFIEPRDVIDLLRPLSTVLRFGARYLPGLRGQIASPRLTAAAAGSWVAENPGSDTADTNLTLDRMGPLAPKFFQITTSFSKNLLQQASSDAEQMVRQDLALTVATAFDLAAIAGTGANNQPTGILSQAGVGSVALGANGAVPTYDAATNLEETVGKLNGDVGSCGFITTPSVRRRYRKTGKMDATGPDPSWTDDNRLISYPAAASTNVPSNLTKGTSTTICHAILFGNWNDLIIAGWEALDIIVDPYRLKKQGMIEVTCLVGVDIGLRHPASFAVIKDALP